MLRHCSAPHVAILEGDFAQTDSCCQHHACLHCSARINDKVCDTNVSKTWNCETIASLSDFISLLQKDARLVWANKLWSLFIIDGGKRLLACFNGGWRSSASRKLCEKRWIGWVLVVAGPVRNKHAYHWRLSASQSLISTKCLSL